VRDPGIRGTHHLNLAGAMIGGGGGAHVPLPLRLCSVSREPNPAGIQSARELGEPLASPKSPANPLHSFYQSSQCSVNPQEVETRTKHYQLGQEHEYSRRRKRRGYWCEAVGNGEDAGGGFSWPSSPPSHRRTSALAAAGLRPSRRRPSAPAAASTQP
jgi:hypothetical protein